MSSKRVWDLFRRGSRYYTERSDALKLGALAPIRKDLLAVSESIIVEMYDRCMHLEPLHPVDPNFRWDKHRDRPSLIDGREYTLRDGGPISRIEQNRAIRAFWCL